MVLFDYFIPILTSFCVLSVLVTTSDQALLCIFTCMLLCVYIYISYKKAKKINKEHFLQDFFLLVSIIAVSCIVFSIYSLTLFNTLKNTTEKLHLQNLKMQAVVMSSNMAEDKVELIGKYEGIKVKILMDNINTLQIGDEISIRGKFYKVKQNTNVGQFDNMRYMFSKGIVGTVYVNKENSKIVSTNLILKSLNKARDYIVDRAVHKFSGIKKQVAASLISSAYKQLDKETKQSFVKAGLSHILSISGTHFTILLMPIFFIAGYLFKNRYLSLVVFIFFTLLLLWITGFETSSIRAALCFCIYKASTVFFYDSNKLWSLSIAVLFLLLLNPLVVYDLGFVYGISSILSIIIINPKLHKFELYTMEYLKLLQKKISQTTYSEGIYRHYLKKPLNTFFKYIISSVLLILSVQPAGIIVTYIYFNKFYTFSVISNIIMFFFITPLVFSIWACMFIPKIFYYPASFLLDILINTSIYFSRLKYSVIHLKNISVYVFLIVILFIFLINQNIIRRKKTILLSSYIAILLCCIIFMFSNSTKVMFFDVGQGDSALITTFMGYKILIDTGEYTDSGIIAAHCGQRINAILITHPDLDHYGGIFNILDNFTVDVVYLPHTLHEDNIKFISTLKEQYEDINIQLLKSGDYIQHKNLRIDILHPIAGRDTNNINDESIVMKVKLSNYSILFTGDMNLSKLSSFIDISSDVIKMPHHGDSKVINKQSLSKVGASLGVISVGADNRYGHPNKQTLQLMNMFKMKTLRTDLEGQISIYILLNSYYLFTYR